MQIHPKSGRIAEIFGEMKYRVRGDPTPSVDQITDTLAGNMDRACQLALGELHGEEKFIQCIVRRLVTQNLNHGAIVALTATIKAKVSRKSPTP